MARKSKLAELEDAVIAAEKRRILAQKQHEERMADIETNLRATSRLLRAGAKMLLQVQEAQKQLIDGLRQPTNGHSKRKLS